MRGEHALVVDVARPDVTGRDTQPGRPDARAKALETAARRVDVRRPREIGDAPVSQLHEMLDGDPHAELVVHARARLHPVHAPVEDDERQAFVLELADELVRDEDARDEEPVDPALEQEPPVGLAA